MTEDLSWVPQGVDLENPNVARLYDYYLGGGHHFDVDRKLAEEILARAPEVRDAARHNRSFLNRSVRYLANAGIRQFLDLGSGIPTVGNVHEVAHRVSPDCRVVYVDYEAIAVAHAELLLENVANVDVIQRDLRDPVGVLSDPKVGRLLDFSQPVAVLMYAVLHFVADEDDPDAIVRRYREATVPGSYLAISHVTIEHDLERLAPAAELYKKSSSPIYVRTRADMRRFFTGYDLVDPGIVYTPQWRPDSAADEPDNVELATLYCALGRRTAD